MKQKLVDGNTIYPTKFRIKPWIFVSIMCLTFFLTGCGVSGYDMYEGIGRVAPRQQPPADKLIWSRADPNIFLINASEVGFGLSLGAARVYTLDISTGKIEVIVETGHGFFGLETWSPDEQKVVLDIPADSIGYENYGGIWIWDSQTRDMEYLRERGLVRWSPSENVVAVSDESISRETEELHIVDLATGQKNVTVVGKIDEIGYILDMDWSPDGKHLVLSMGSHEASIPLSLYIFNIQDHSLLPLTHGGDDTYPVWSPLGDKIAYVREIPGSRVDTIHLINIDGSCDISFPYIDSAWSLSWSPDGERLAFIGPSGIYTITVETFLDKYVGANPCP